MIEDGPVTAPFDRRTFLQRSSLAAGALTGGVGADRASDNSQDTGGGAAFPVYNGKAFGAHGDGRALDTGALQHAIDAAAAAGGGVAYVPPGTYLTGTLQIRSRVTLYLEAGATLAASPRREDYQFGCLIYAEDAPDIALSGRGTVEGGGPNFWRRKADGTWTSRDWRPSELLRFLRCPNLLLEDITLKDSPNWTVHSIDCDRVTIRGLSVINGLGDDDGPNTDGIMLDGCSTVRVSDCFVQGGDDCIVLKCMQARTQVCRDVTVTNCVLITSESGLKIGSDTYGEFYNITFSNCAIRDAGCGIGLWMRDGGLVDGWTISNIAMTLTGGGQPIYFWSHRRTDDTPWGTVRNVTISNLTATGDGGIFLSGVPDRYLENITLDTVRIHMRGAFADKLHTDPPFPFPIWDHRRSPYDIYCRYVKNLALRHIHFTRAEPEHAEWGGAIRCHNIDGLDIEGFLGRQSHGSDAPVIDLRNVKDAFVRGCRAPAGTGTFVHVGEGTSGVSLMNNDLRKATAASHVTGGVSPAELYESGNRRPSRSPR